MYVYKYVHINVRLVVSLPWLWLFTEPRDHARVAGYHRRRPPAPAFEALDFIEVLGTR